MDCSVIDPQSDFLLQENEMSADQQAFQVAMGAVQEAEEEVVDLHGQYFAHRDKMDKMLIPLYQMTNEVDYDVDGEQILFYVSFYHIHTFSYHHSVQHSCPSFHYYTFRFPVNLFTPDMS